MNYEEASWLFPEFRDDIFRLEEACDINKPNDNGIRSFVLSLLEHDLSYYSVIQLIGTDKERIGSILETFKQFGSIYVHEIAYFGALDD